MKDGIYYYPHFDQLTHIQYLEVDNILQQWRKEQNIILKILQEDVDHLLNTIWQDHSPLAYDPFCQREINFLCSECQAVDRIIEVNQQNTLLPSEKWHNLRLTMKYMILTRVFLKERSQLASYLSELDRLTCCGTPKNYRNLRLIQGDSFTVSGLIQIFLYQKLRRQKIYTIQPIWKLFICQSQGKQILEPLHYQKLPDKYCSAEIILMILLQALVTWKEFNNYHASLGDVKPNWFGFQKQDFNLNIYGIKISSPITLWFCHFLNASVTINNNHYYSERPQLTAWQHQFLLAPQLDRKTWKMPHEDIFCYRLQKESWHWYQTVRHLGAPLFVGSWDFYCFIVSFCLDPRIMKIIKNYPELDRFWRFFWLPDELKIVEERMLLTNDVQEILMGIWLRCQIIDDLIVMVKTYNIF